MIDMTKGIVYHAYTDEQDFYSKNYKKAKQKYNEYKKTNENCRLYSMEERGDDLFDLDCLESCGAYPF